MTSLNWRIYHRDGIESFAEFLLDSMHKAYRSYGRSGWSYSGMLPISEGNWAFVPEISVYRDSETIEESNWDYVIEFLESRDYVEFEDESRYSKYAVEPTDSDDYCIQSSTSDLVGWVDKLAIRVKDESGNITPIMHDIFELLERLDSDSCLDCDDYYSRLHAEFEDSIESEFGSVLGRYAQDGIDPHWTLNVYSEFRRSISERIADQWEDHNYVDYHEVKELIPELTKIMIALGYADLGTLYREGLIEWRDYPVIALLTEIRDRIWTLKYKIRRAYYRIVRPELIGIWRDIVTSFRKA